jgi:hypothetical protein
MPETSRDVFFGKQANFQSDTSTGNNDGHSHSIADDATTIGTNRKRKQKTTNAGRQAGRSCCFLSPLSGVSIKNTQETETVHNQNKTKSPSYQEHEDEKQKKKKKKKKKNKEMFTTEFFSTKIEIKMGPAACCCCCA